MASRPVAVGMALCDYVIIEQETKKVSLIGNFTRAKVREFPGPPDPFSVYAVLTDGLGDVTIELVIARLDTGEEIYNRRYVVRFPDKLSDARLHVRMQRYSFPAPGYYQFTLLADGEWLAQRRVLFHLEEE
jgi:hypothetical protein